MEKSSSAEFQSPSRSFYKPFIVDGYDHNFHILDNAVSALENTCGEHQQQIDALKADVALKVDITDVDAKDAVVLSSAKAYAEAQDAVILGNAKAYTDSRESIVRIDMAAADAAVLSDAKGYADTKAASALFDAKAYTDSRESIVRIDMAAADAAVLSDAKGYAEVQDAVILGSAKGYADQAVAALVDGAPEALDTLKELAAALGNNADFSATVMAEIGKRVQNTDPRLSDARNVIDQNGNGTLKLWSGTQTQYDALAVKANDTLYFIR